MTLKPANASKQFECGFCGHRVVRDAVTLHRHYLLSHTTLFRTTSPEKPSFCPREDCLWVLHESGLKDHLTRHRLYDAGKLVAAERCDDCRLKIDGYTLHFQTGPHILTSFLRLIIPISSDKHPPGIMAEITQISWTRAGLDDAHQQVAIPESNAQHLSLSNSRFKHSSIGTEDRGGMMGVKRKRAGEAKRSYHTVRKLAPSNSTPRPHIKMAIESQSKRIGVSDLLCTDQHAQRSDTHSGGDTAPLQENAVAGRWVGWVDSVPPCQ
jgi:hypothetical protein